MLRIAITVKLLLILSLFAPGQDRPIATQLTLKEIGGRTLRLRDYRGKVVLLNFWATWCAPCRAEMPDLVKWQHEYRKYGLQIIGITYPPGNLADVRKFTESIKINYPVVMGEKQTKEIFDKGEILPITVVIDKMGVVRKVIQGIIYPEEFEQYIKPLLR
jgi:thiol-disulfide isomerase/thioredoxin